MSKKENTNYVRYKKATTNSKAKQSDADKFVKEIKKGWWAKNRDKFINAPISE